MAESSDGQEKTEEPTGKRISDARKKGQLPRSREAGTFFVLISGVCSLWLVAPYLGHSMIAVMEHSFSLSREQVFDLYEMGRVFYQNLFAIAIPLLVICGSVNPITVAQMEAAERSGIVRWQMTPEQKLQPGYWQTNQGEQELAALQDSVARYNPFILDTNDPGDSRLTQDYARRHGIDLDGIRLGISQAVGYLVSKLFPDPNVGTLLITGGDTLLQCMNYMGVDQVEPVCELSAGVVLSLVTYQGHTRCILTKSGGFGQETLVTDLARLLAGPEKMCKPQAVNT